MTLAPICSAKATPCSTALPASSDPSVGIRSRQPQCFSASIFKITPRAPSDLVVAFVREVRLPVNIHFLTLLVEVAG